MGRSRYRWGGGGHGGGWLPIETRRGVETASGARVFFECGGARGGRAGLLRRCTARCGARRAAQPDEDIGCQRRLSRGRFGEASLATGQKKGPGRAFFDL
jgi:hypothetical protein